MWVADGGELTYVSFHHRLSPGPKEKEATNPREPKRDVTGEGAFEGHDPDSER